MTMKFSGASGITFPDDTIQDTAARMPPGGIILWSGSTANIPAGWFLCNGQNGTPNLVDKFIVCAGGAYAVNATGGSADAVVVSHTHNVPSGGTHSHTVTNGGNDGSFRATSIISGGGNTNATGGFATGEMWNAGYSGGGGTGNSTTQYSYNSQHTHTIAADTGAHTHTLDSAGVSGTNANLPPYYALCYIMRG